MLSYENGVIMLHYMPVDLEDNKRPGSFSELLVVAE
jgi:hypothetical protein